VEAIGKIRSWHRIERLSISQIARRLGAPRNTIKKYLKSKVTAPKYAARPKRFPLMGPWAARLLERLREDAGQAVARTTQRTAFVRHAGGGRFLAVAYLREAQEMVFDAHWRAFRLWGGCPDARVESTSSRAGIPQQQRERAVQAGPLHDDGALTSGGACISCREPRCTNHRGGRDREAICAGTGSVD